MHVDEISLKFLRVLFEVILMIACTCHKYDMMHAIFFNISEKCTRQTNLCCMLEGRGNLHACFSIPPLPIRYGLGLKVFFGRGFVCEANFEYDDEGEEEEK